MRHDLRPWNLQDVIRDLNNVCATIESVYLFGSRAYETGSYRSDIDLLVYSKRPLLQAALCSWINETYNPVDLFETNDLKIARSLINGSAIACRKDDLIGQLDAIQLWSSESGFSRTFTNWDQFTLKDISYDPTVLPLTAGVAEVARNFAAHLSSEGLPDTFLGSDWLSVGRGICMVIERALECRKKLGGRASSMSKNATTLRDEYDFQNLIHLVLRPWLPSTEPENLVIRYQGQDKKADFSIERNTIVIEAKHIKDDNDKRAILKDLEGLKDFYIQNPNIKLLLFLILVNPGISLDYHRIAGDYSDENHSPVVLVRCLTNDPPS